MMPYLFLLLIGMVVYHFVYEGVVAPSLRLYIQFRLFKLRDELRRIRYDTPSELSAEDFKLHQEHLNNGISLMSTMTLHVLMSVIRVLKQDHPLVQHAKNRLARLDRCSNVKVKEIREETAKLLLKALVINSGGWFVWLIPIIICIGFEMIQNNIGEVTSLPRPEAEKLVPSMVRHAA